MAGMDMMLKSFGIDPEIIRNTVGEMAQGVIQVKNQLGAIEARLVGIEETHKEILEILKNGYPRTEIDRDARSEGSGTDRRAESCG